MKITRVEVKGFGALKDISLTFSREAPMILLYGQNEAGKSTLMHFIRAILFGFANRGQGNERYEPIHGGVHGGVLELCGEDGRTVRIQRYDAPGPTGRRPSAGTVTVSYSDGVSGGEELLRQIVGDMTSDVYRNLFAFGLTELEEIRTLQSDEISGYLYRSGFGVSGASILEAEKRVASELERLFKPRGKKQTLNMLADQLDALDMRLRQSRGDVDRYQAITAEIDRLRERSTAYEFQIREAQMRELWIDKCLKSQEPWQKLRAAESELQKLPVVSKIPEDALRRFDEEKLRLEELHMKHAQVVEQLSSIAQELQADEPDERLLRLRHEIDELWERASVVRSLETEQHDASRELVRLEEQISSQIVRIDASWTEVHIAQVNASLSERAEILAYREQMTALERKLESASLDMTKLQGELVLLARRRAEAAEQASQGQAQLESHPAGAWATMSSDARRKWKQGLARAMDGWRQAEAEVAYAQRSEQEQQARGKRMKAMLMSLIVCTIVLPSALLPFGWIEPAIAVGSVMLLLTIVMFGLSRRSRSDAGRSVTQLKRVREQRAREVQELLEQTAGSEMLAAAAREKRGRGEQDHAWTLAEAATWFEEFEILQERLHMAEADQRRLADRVTDIDKQMTDMQGRYEDLEEQQSRYAQQLDQMKHEWHMWLEVRKLPERLMPETVIELLTLVEQVKQIMRVRDSVRERIRSYRERIETYEKQVSDICDELGHSDPGNRSVYEDVKLLAELVAREVELVERRDRLQLQAVERQAELEQLVERIQLTEQRIQQLWDEAGASDEAEYRVLIARYVRRQELQAIIADALTQLEWLVTPAELERLRETLMQTGGAALEAERTELEGRVVSLRAELDRVRDERAKLEVERDRLRDGGTLADLLQSKEELLSEVKKHTAEYLVYAMAGGLLTRTRELYERERQPKVLQQASHYMETITGGRYVRVLTPFGEQRLIVERSDGLHVDTASLSRGTAEQLYLAMRCALVTSYSEGRDALPIVLDDIFVNFDEDRAARCLQVIQELAGRHQVLMFTCHDYMRRLVSEQLPDTQIIELVV